MRFRLVVVAAMSSLVVPFTCVAADAAPALRFSTVQYDSPGSDRGSNHSLNAEWIRLTNHGSKARVLTGWTLRDRTNHVFRFPTFKLRPGRSVRVHTGRGFRSATDLYWRQGWYVWNNTGDRAILRNRHGVVVDACRWRDGGGRTSC